VTHPPEWVLVTGDLVRTGGQDRANFELARFLLDRGDRVHLVAHRVAPELTDRPNAQVWAVPRPGGRHLLGHWFLNRAGRRVAARVTTANPAARVVVNGTNCRWPDISWIHMVHSAAPLHDRLAPPAARIKHRLTRAADRRAERRFLPRCRVLVANSARTARQLADSVGAEPARIRVCPLGTDPDVFRPAGEDERAAARRTWGLHPAERVILFIGALGYDCNKGFDRLIAAVARLANDRAPAPVRVLAVGGGQLAFWQRHLERAGVADRVRLLGPTDRVPELLAAADLVVSPTRYDSYGLAVHEALCRGVPALVSSRAGVSDVFPPELRGLIVPDPEDDADLAARIGRTLSAGRAPREAAARLGDDLRRRRWHDMAAEFARLVNPIPVPPS
jgi:glycosyltransferase involved in cell wall biosynthesis